MVERQLRARGISDEALLRVMAQVPREHFIPEEEREHAYEDRAVSIGDGQTISQPYIVGFMIQQLAVEEHHRVLEIGTGLGYQSAILAGLASCVLSIERIPSLKQKAESNLAALEIGHVTLLGGDGSMGREEFAPYDRIVVSAGAPDVAQPLVDQLAEGGRLVLPIGGAKSQTISLIVRKGARIVETPLLPCRFVKLIGRQGWDAG